MIVAIHRVNQKNLPFMLFGVGLPQLAGLAGEAKSYAERLFDFPVIGSLDRQQAAEVLTVPAADLGVEYSPEALEILIDHTEGYPYFLQEWGYHLWNYATGNPISADDARAVVPLVLDRLDRNFFLVRLDRLTPKEKEYLKAMADLGSGPHRSGDIAAKLGVRVESVAPRRSALIGKGMIYSPAHGDTAFTVPLFDEFLHRAMRGPGRARPGRR